MDTRPPAEDIKDIAAVDMAVTSIIPSSSAPRCHLMELCAELRNRIVEYTLYHEEDGVIAPIPDGPLANARVWVAGERHVYRDGYLAEISHCARAILQEHHNQRSEGWQQRAEDKRTRMCRLQALKTQIKDAVDKRGGKQLHICRLDCLVQPPITQVSRQLRQESLSVFYHINTFHLEMHHEDRGQRMLTDWWRAIGYANLRSIGSISVVFDHPQLHQLSLVRLGKRQSFVVDERLSNVRWTQAEIGKSMEKAKAQIRILEEDGLHARALECLTGAVGYQFCLRDQSSLDEYWHMNQEQREAHQKASRPTEEEEGQLV